MVAFLILLAVFVALTAIQYLLAPRPAQTKPETKDLDNPTAEAGREIPVIFGTITVKALNVLDYGDKSINSYQVKA